MDIYDIDITENKYDFSKSPIASQISDKMPKIVINTINFKLFANAQFANALRRVALSELKAKALTFELQTIQKNDDAVIPYLVQSRISFIRINQNIDDNAVFALDVINNTNEEMIIYSGQLKQISGKHINLLETVRICILRPGCYLKVPKITVEQGYGYEHSRFSITADFRYKAIDYVKVRTINPKGNIKYETVKYSDISEFTDKEKLISDNIDKNAIVIIPNDDYSKNIADENKERIKKMKYQINKKVYYYQASQCNPEYYAMSFVLYGNIEPIVFMNMIFDNIIDRFKHIQNDFANNKTGHISITYKGNTMEIVINDEDHTIGQLLRRTIYELDPKISMVKLTIDHPLNRCGVITIVHNDPNKIFRDALITIIADMVLIKNKFNKSIK